MNKELLKEIIRQNKLIQDNMPKLYKEFTPEEKIIIDTFMTKAKPYCKGHPIVYDLRNKDINLMINRMQIGRLAFRKDKKHMQILLNNVDVLWIKDITLAEALKHIDDWLEYLQYLSINHLSKISFGDRIRGRIW